MTEQEEAPVHVIVNPNAGVIRNGRLDLADLSETLGAQTHVTITRDLEHLDEVVQTLRREEVQRVAVLGGDGTILNLCTRLEQAWGGEAELPSLFLLGGGTTNALMVDLGLPLKPRERLARLQGILRGEIAPSTEQRNTLRVNGSLGFIFGAGYLRRASELYESQPVKGVWTSLLVTLKVVKGMLFREPSIVALLDDVRASVAFDGAPIGLDVFNIAYFSTISRNGLKLKMTPAATAAADRFEAVLTRVSVSEFLRIFFKMTFGATMKARVMERRLVESVRFDFPKPTSWFMDGEQFEPVQTLSVELGPRLRLLT